jgi:FKBP-type peptidyl-prolyl cis-trans isomerase
MHLNFVKRSTLSVNYVCNSFFSAKLFLQPCLFFFILLRIAKCPFKRLFKKSWSLCAANNIFKYKTAIMIKNVLGSLLLVCAMFASFTGMAQDQKLIDEKILTEYFAKNKIKAMRTPSGLYYTISKKGTGENAKAGKQVTMNYIGKFLDGKKFDGNVDENFAPAGGRTPLTFTLGVGQVIKGWDEGVQLLNKGARGTLYIPSGLAYGPGGRGPIPPNSILMFDVELLSMAD